MTECTAVYQSANATVRIFGTPSRDRWEAAAIQFLKDVEKCKQQKKQKEETKR